MYTKHPDIKYQISNIKLVQVSPDKDDSPTLEIVPFGSQDGGRGEGRGEKREVVISILFTSFARMNGEVIIIFLQFKIFGHFFLFII